MVARRLLAALLLLFISSTAAQAAPMAPFDGYLMLDGGDDVAVTSISGQSPAAITIEASILLTNGSSSPIDRLQIAATGDWIFYVTRYSLGGTRTGCIGYLGPGGWEHCRTSTMGLNVWHHVALTAQNGQGQFFLDGAAFGNPRSISTPTLGGALDVGRNLDGTLDEVRISSAARYHADFALPSQKFPCDSNTVALWGFDEPAGSTYFLDRCGGPALVGQYGARSAGGPYLARKAYMPLVFK
jgi:hypothetical protein